MTPTGDGLPPFLEMVLGARERELVRPRAPGFVPPMRPTPTRQPYPSRGWVYEPRLDGLRTIVVRDERGAHLWSADRADLTAGHPELAAAVEARVPPGVVADGWILTGGRGGPVLHLSDLIVVGGYDVTALAMRTRTRLLAQSTEPAGRLRLTAHCGPADDTARQRVLRHRETLVARRSAAPYREGRRSPDWLTTVPDPGR